MKIDLEKIIFTKVSEDDLRFLYNHLKERDPIAYISHKSMPSYKEHVKFVLSKPYSYWYIIKINKTKLGSIYLSKQNEIGIFLRKEFQGSGIGGYILEMLLKKHPRKRFLANISPKNKNSMKFFKKHRFNLIQYTYELEE
ncbi:GNAT family N-acetyltransferase [Candidatus Nitrosopelagicus sp.]|nr:GNAT family N-acetyltransferase [Candidatus Nitrosopelagicus sp.]